MRQEHRLAEFDLYEARRFLPSALPHSAPMHHHQGVGSKSMVLVSGGPEPLAR